MTKRLFILSLLLGAGLLSQAQLKGIFNKVKDKSEQRANKKIDSEIDKALDKAEGKTTGTSPGTEAGTKEPAALPATDNPIKSYSRYDFIPGDSILYAEDFQQDAIGELPLNWNTSGTGEVTTLDKYPGNWLRLHKSFTYLTSNKKEFTENYTVEFDIILQLKNNGWAYPEVHFGLFSSGGEDNTGNDFLRDHRQYASVVATLSPGEFRSTKVRLNSWQSNKSYFRGDGKNFEALEKTYGTPVHVAIQVQKERYRMWINDEKIFDIPKAVPPGNMFNQLYLQVGGTNYTEDQYALFVNNFKVATGRPDTRHKLVEEGRFSTNGILFDFQSAVIRAESYAVVKEIAGVLKEYKDIKVKVVGHTSSDGDDNANMELSRKRATAVKDLLTGEFGIDASRIETEGKGETQPIADNKTREGKIANRRVEFIKL